MRLTICAMFIAVAALAGCRRGAQPAEAEQSPADPTPVIVEINDSPEHLSAFDRFVKARLSDFYPQLLQNQTGGDELRSRLFDEFVQRQLIVHQARRRGLAATDEEIGRALEDQHQQANLEGAGHSQTTLAGSERRIELASDLLTMKFYQAEVLKGSAVTPEEIEAYYRENQSRYQQRNGFYVREIRVASAEQANELHALALRKPADFATLARQHSSAPHAAGGGLIYYATEQMPAVLEQAISPLKVGSISRVVRSNYGYHIFKLEARAEPLPLEKVREQIEEDLLSRKNQALIDAYNERAAAGARIRVYRERLGFNYTGLLPDGGG